MPAVKIQPQYRRGAARYDPPIDPDGYSPARVAMANEVLAKVLCHNLVVNVHEMHELGIDPDAFGSPPKVEPRIIRFPNG